MTGVVSLRGVVPVVPTTFHPDESIDAESLSRVVDWIASQELAGMCLPAYGSEFYKLTGAERDQVVGIAVEVNDGRVPVVAQANHGSARVAAELARRYTDMGADVVSFAIPRQFGASTADILHYCVTVAAATPLPILIQDFNPGGPTIGADLVSDLLGRADNFRFLKLEDPMMLDKLIAIRSETAGRISILEGWGGLYMLEGIAVGIDGIMPGAAIADLLDTVFRAAVSQPRSGAHDLFGSPVAADIHQMAADAPRSGAHDLFGSPVAADIHQMVADAPRSRAHDLLGSLLPFISFALQDFELFLQIEKRTLSRRGLIASPTVRSLSSTPSPAVLDHVDFLIDQVERLASEVFDQAW